MTKKVIDLGDDHTIEFFSYKGDSRAGAIVTHKTPAGVLCESFISIRGHAWGLSLGMVLQNRAGIWCPMIP